MYRAQQAYKISSVVKIKTFINKNINVLFSLNKSLVLSSKAIAKKNLEDKN